MERCGPAGTSHAPPSGGALFGVTMDNASIPNNLNPQNRRRGPRRYTVELSDVHASTYITGRGRQQAAIRAAQEEASGEAERKRQLAKLQELIGKMRRLRSREHVLWNKPEGSLLDDAISATLPSETREIIAWTEQGEQILSDVREAVEVYKEQERLAELERQRLRKIAQIREARKRAFDASTECHAAKFKRTPRLSKRERCESQQKAYNKAPRCHWYCHPDDYVEGEWRRSHALVTLGDATDLRVHGRIRPRRLKRERNGHLRDDRRLWRREVRRF